MAIFAISDLHLSLGIGKPMDIFGDNWINHEKKIENNWREKVKEEDLVLLPGDFSWAMYLEEALEDFKFINNLPGKKLLLKGNHDYWWTTLTKIRKFLEENDIKNIDFLHNNSYLFENKIIAGTRGWSEQEEQPERMLKREKARLKISLKDGVEKFGEDKEIIVCMHYPPFNSYNNAEFDFIRTMKDFNVKQCVYGHIHGESQKEAKQGLIDNIKIQMVSSDYLNFNLVKIS